MPQILVTLTDEQLVLIDWRADQLGLEQSDYIAGQISVVLEKLKDLFETFHVREATEAFRKLPFDQKRFALAALKGDISELQKLPVEPSPVP